MIVVPELGDRFHRMWMTLFDLAVEPPAPWSLIGAHMVALHGWSRGRTQIRPSQDADILINVRSVSDGTERMSLDLLRRGFAFDGASLSNVGHRFRRDDVSIDLLAPDGIGEHVNVTTIRPARTVRVPGGTQALRRTRDVAVSSREASGSVPIPDLLGAILVKVRAIAVDDAPEVQRRDAAFLLSLIDDPDALASTLTTTERRWLRNQPDFANPDATAYDATADPEEAALAFRRLAGIR